MDIALSQYATDHESWILLAADCDSAEELDEAVGGVSRYKRYQIDGTQHRLDTRRRYGAFSSRMSGGAEQVDRRIQMHRIRLFAVATAVIFAGVGAWAASTTTRARIDTPSGASIDPLQMTRDAKDLPTGRFVDYSLVFN